MDGTAMMDIKLYGKERLELTRKGVDGGGMEWKSQNFQRSDSSSLNQAGFSTLNEADCWRRSARVLMSGLWLWEEPSMNSGDSGMVNSGVSGTMVSLAFRGRPT